MFKRILTTSVLSFMLLAGAVPALAQTATNTPAVPVTTGASNLDAMLAQIKALTEMLNKLKAELAATRIELNDLKGNLREGMTDDDIKKVQEVLAKDPAIYPAGLATGYFGQMTKEALKRFQAKNGLEVTGELDAETRAALEAIMAERKASGKEPIQLLLDGGLKDKFQERLRNRCEKLRDITDERVCAQVKLKYKWENWKDDKKDEMNDDEDEMEDEEDDSSDEDTTISLRDTSRQIDDATKAAMDLKRKLDRKGYSKSIAADVVAEAKAVLVDATKDIVDARAARRDGDIEEAYNLALGAEQDLDDAKDALEGERSDDEDDSEDDEDEDDDDEDEDDDDN